MNTTCNNCEYHEEYYVNDGIDFYNDGCVCHHEKGDREYHIYNCMEYVFDGEQLMGCPYFKEKE